VLVLLNPKSNTWVFAPVAPNRKLPFEDEFEVAGSAFAENMSSLLTGVVVPMPVCALTNKPTNKNDTMKIIFFIT
jgi:hypothetical protein